MCSRCSTADCRGEQLGEKKLQHTDRSRRRQLLLLLNWGRSSCWPISTMRIFYRAELPSLSLVANRLLWDIEEVELKGW